MLRGYFQHLILFFLWILITASSASAPVTLHQDKVKAILPDPQLLLKEATRLAWLDNWTAAAPVFKRAESLFHAHGDKRNEIYAQLGSLRSEALPLTEVSRVLASRLKTRIVRTDLKLRLWCLAIKGYTDIDVDSASAKRAWTEVLSISSVLGDSAWELRAKGELGVIAFLEGNPARAVSLVGQAILSLIATNDKAGEARLLTMLGFGYTEVRRYAEAHWFFRQAISLMEATPDAGIPFNALVGDAEALAGLDRSAEAVDLLKRLLAKADERRAHWHEISALVTLGELAAKAQDVQLAKEYLLRATTDGRKLHLYRDVSQAMIDLARIYRLEGDLKSADAALRDGLIASQHIGDRYYIPRDLTAAAELKVAEREFEQADVLFERAERVVDEILVNQHTEIGKAALAGSMSETYLKHFRLVQQRGDVARAFHLLERVRGRSWPIHFPDSEAGVSKSDKAAELETNIAAIQVKLLDTADEKMRTELQDRLLQSERTLAFEENEVPTPQRPVSQPAYLSSVQHVLRDDELLLEYVLDEPNASCIAITRKGAEILKLRAGAAQIQKEVTEYQHELSEKHSRPELAKHLYAILMGKEIEKFGKVRWIIAPDGILHFLPFEALQRVDGAFVLDSQIVSYTPSATAIQLSRSIKREDAPLPLLAVGDVTYEDRVVPQVTNARTAWGPLAILRDLTELSHSRLHNLPESREEVLAIAQIAGPQSRLLLGRDATESALKREAPSNYRVIHMAVHALADSRYPDRSALVLARDDPPEDGLLQVREINRMHLSADLVTLSACQTGIGPTEGEAGVISLEQAFLNAGAKAVVASLWNVEDQSTTQLMGAFYRHLADKEDKAAALRSAKRELLNANPSIPPYYWAGFVLVGEGSTPVLLK
jgi:CHAT domain-containing protein